MMLKSLVNNIKNIKVPWGMSVYEEISAKVMMNLVITFKTFLIYSSTSTTQKNKSSFVYKITLLSHVAKNSV